MTQYKCYKITANIEEFYVGKLLDFTVSSHWSCLTKSNFFPVTLDCDVILIFPIIFDCDII